ncbi:MAG: tetratricopeptide repeat protein [Thermodesulfobacteriota bacterium]|nr:tetratricopeptide repeat protein [Thermodesulfobacteriota bacterium]
MARILFTCHLAALIIGCNYMGLVEEKYLDDSPKKSCVLMGEVKIKGRTSRPVLVVAFSKQYSVRQKAQITRVTDSILLKEPGPYMLHVAEGEYNVAAFIDFNENLIYESDDFAGWYGMPDTVSVKSEQVMGGLDIVVSEKTDKSFGFPILIKASDYEDKKNLGLENEEVIDLDDKIFSNKYSSMGLWSPANFIIKTGINIYSLEKYDESKTPILYIHGAGGSPRDFNYLANNINRDLYQPWFFYYPSGMKIEKISDILYKKIEVLHNKYKFKVLYITAHSMGGLVSRALINKYDSERKFDFLRLYISISTPYGGNEVSRLGVEYSPAHISCWEDVATGSDFLKKLFIKKMPPKIRFYLIFGYAGDSRIFKDLDDGIISLKSQLDPQAKAEAVLTCGFDEDHISILSSNKMFEKYNEILLSEYANISKEIKEDAKKVLRHGEYRVITKITEPMALENKSLAQNNTDTLTEKSKRKYINMLRSIKDGDVIQAAKKICRLYPRDTELVETADSKLLKKFKKKSNASNHIDAISWLCNILGTSEDVRFISTLSKVKQETDNEKIKRYAELNLAKLMKISYYPLNRFSRCINGERINGRGTMILPDKTIYTGEFQRGLMHGNGKITFPDKSGYKGSWFKDKMHGEGVITYPDGAVYTGRVSNNVRHGHGYMVFPGGMKFTGEFRNDMRHGHGKRVFPDGTTYEGIWRNSRIRGKETVFLPHYEKTDTATLVKESFPDGMQYIDAFKDRLSARQLNAELRIERGNTLYFTGNYEYAIIYYGKVLELFPNNKTAYINRGTAYAKKGLFIKAIDDFSKALEIDPENSVSYNNRGFAWEKRGYYNRALEDFNKALNINPHSIDALNNRGCIWIIKGKPDRAIDDFNKILDLDNNNDIAYYNRGCAWIEKKIIKKALNDLQNALKLKPADSRYKTFLALLKEKAGEK